MSKVEEKVKKLRHNVKVDMLFDEILSCYCTPEIFLENVMATIGACIDYAENRAKAISKIKKDLQKMNTRKEIKEYVNAYI